MFRAVNWAQVIARRRKQPDRIFCDESDATTNCTYRRLGLFSPSSLLKDFTQHNYLLVGLLSPATWAEIANMSGTWLNRKQSKEMKMTAAWFVSGRRTHFLGVPHGQLEQGSRLWLRHRREWWPRQSALRQWWPCHRHLGRPQSWTGWGETPVSTARAENLFKRITGCNANL